MTVGVGVEVGSTAGTEGCDKNATMNSTRNRSANSQPASIGTRSTPIAQRRVLRGTPQLPQLTRLLRCERSDPSYQILRFAASKEIIKGKL